MFIHHLVSLAVQQNAPVPGQSFGGGMLSADARGAVRGDCVVPTRTAVEGIDGVEVLEETFAHLVHWQSHAVELHVLPMPVVCPDSQYVPLVGNDVDQLVLPVEAADRGVALADFLPRFDGKADGRSVVELEADDGMGHPG